MQEGYIKRDIEDLVKRLVKEYKILTILGPRQSGKTSLVRHLFPSYTYVNLEKHDSFLLARDDINEFFKRYQPPLIIDEVQRAPELLNEIQYIVDNNENYGQFILTGSFQQKVKSTVSQSLAGRTAVLKLLPLSINELKNSHIACQRDELLLRGFMPELYRSKKDQGIFYDSYIQTYVERDVQSLLNIKDKNLFDKFLNLLAGRVACVINYESLANDVGVSSSTISSWISVLESSYIIHLLHPYYENFNKRFIKSPKLYFTEPGVVSYLLGLSEACQVPRDPLFGSLFENMLINEILKTLNKRVKGKIYTT